MSLQGRRLAADGAAYTYADFEQWYGARARHMWEGAAATEHSQSQWRLAADGAAYTYADFEQWYGAHARRMWEGAAATEHSQSRTPQSSNVRPVQCSAGDGADAAERRERAAATEHSGSTGLQASSSGSEAPHPAGATACAGALPRTATEHSVMQCVVCERPLCGAEDLAFFWRVNKQGGKEVHLMLKPENEKPATFIRAPTTEKGAMASWQCACGFKFGDTRAVAVRKAAMTAFKSSSVMLCGQRFPSTKSKWPSIYNRPPFNTIEVRTRDTFHGTTPT